jgi:hypothetical protein
MEMEKEFEQAVELFLSELDKFVEQYSNNVEVAKEKLNQLTYELKNN